MRTTAHEGIREDLKAFLDGELRLPRRSQVRRHISVCSDCQKEIEEMKKITHSLFASESTSVLSDPLRSRLLGTMEDTGGPRPALPPLWRRRSTWLYGGGGAVAAASVLMFGVTYFSALNADSTARTASFKTASFAGSASEDARVFDAPVAAAKAVNTASVVQMNSGSGGPQSAFGSNLAGRIAVSEPHAMKSAADAFVAVRPSSVAGEADSARAVAAAPAAPESYVAHQGVSSNFGGIVRKVDNEARLSVEVDDVERSDEKISDMVRADGGYVANNNLTMEGGIKTDQITVKFPSKDFDSMIVGFSRLGNVVAKNITGEDITDKTGDASADEQALIDQVTDTAQKLHAGHLTERRTAQLEEALNERQQALVEARARLGTLRKTARLATVNLTLTEAPKKAVMAEPKSSFWSGVGETNHAANLAFHSAIRVPIVLGIWIIALSPIWFPLALLYRYLARKQADITGR